MISGQWFQRKRSKNRKQLHKITHNCLKNRKKQPHHICSKSVHWFKRWSKMG